mmetsp:Transcript_4954/g.9313  ORF Transcript_4954/g.9313 Transcript_4954/m.9313 type:complete len:106 (+) Transcript_4954:805-1122(+)
MLAWAASKGAITMAAMYISSRPIFTYIIALSYDMHGDGLEKHHMYIYIIMIVMGFGIAFTGKKLEQLKRKKIEKQEREEKFKEDYEKKLKYKPLPSVAQKEDLHV